MDNKLSLEDSMQYKVAQLLKLDEDRILSSYTFDIIQNRSKAWVGRNIKFKIFKENDWVMMYNSKLGKYHKKLKLRYGGTYKIIKALQEGTFLLLDRYVNLLPKCTWVKIP